MLKAVIFDAYGTLMRITDRRDPYKKLIRREIFSSYLNGITIPDARRICLTEDIMTMRELAKRLTGRDLDTSRYESDLREEVASVELYDDTLRALTWLKDEGIALGLVSNLASPYKEPFFRHDLDKLITEPVFSCEAGMVKPDPRIYLLALERLGIPAENALMIGDSERNDVEGPASIGMESVLLDWTGSKKRRRKIITLDDIASLI